MNIDEKYANDWNSSGTHFLNNNNYDWMCENISDYTTVLEVGSVTGQSTLSLLKNNHRVIVIEKNKYCIEKTKELILANGFYVCDNISDITNNTACLLMSDIILDTLNIFNVEFDIVVCWNIGTAWDRDSILTYINPMEEYGLTIKQIKENIESSYAELIVWKACNIAKAHKSAISIIERGTRIVDDKNDGYYMELKNECDFNEIAYRNVSTTTLSQTGRTLSVDGIPINENEIKIFLNSILLT